MDTTMIDITSYFANASISLSNIFTDEASVQATFTHIHTQSSALIFPLEGNAWIHAGQERFFMTPGRILHISKEHMLHLENCGNGDFKYAVVQYTIDEQVSTEKVYHRTFLLRISDSNLYRQPIDQLIAVQALPGAMAALNRRALFYQLLQYCVEGARDQQLQATVETMDLIIKYIQENYTDKINVTKIAHKYNLERRRLAYLFEKHTGLSPNTYITEYRISKAKILLERAELSIAEVAERVGYDDCFYFSRVFKKQTGQSPSIYRRKQQISWANN
ncbi:helix-turn-helix transcriptional regulator [Kurthia sibirica]|uniref:HTH araC/xylS-type domain-containing protein n=1 Tax=Kurthia sibirica TaxID=202750 RepID=A0A2U3ALD2_9BACL|nr:AraC family transcriptional regulator [Kurthia sibirica]PWI25348.1 hypothetical protein DEX24_08380 [Kurthia sibirica]GEK34405.1 AraC family transcriptional regulator [Kurthia sibirica]